MNVRYSSSAVSYTHLSTVKEWDLKTTDLNRPGLQFTGYYDYFAYERPQVIGKTEMAYLASLSPETQRERLERYFSYPIPCIVIARGMDCPAMLFEACLLYTSRCV